jgi:hypothetical protein
MKVRKVIFPLVNVADTLFNLSGIQDQHVSLILYQAPKGNKDAILFGDRSFQLFELEPGSSGQLPITDTKAFWLKNQRDGDTLTVGLI